MGRTETLNTHLSFHKSPLVLEVPKETAVLVTAPFHSEALALTQGSARGVGGTDRVAGFCHSPGAFLLPAM